MQANMNPSAITRRQKSMMDPANRAVRASHHAEIPSHAPLTRPGSSLQPWLPMLIIPFLLRLLALFFARIT